MQKDIPLGKDIDYPTTYQPELLFPIARNLKRAELGLTQKLPFHGADIWNAYELSWLNQKGKPQVAIGVFEFAFDTLNIIESKSFKLYLNSFNQTKFADWEQVAKQLIDDLTTAAQGKISVTLFSVDEYDSKNPISSASALVIDNLDINVSLYDYKPELLKVVDVPDQDKQIEEKLISHLLKSNCLITNQPDWASVIIEYKGPAIDHKALLSYLISFRKHNEFHEQCVERIFIDIMEYCQPDELTVYARYTRRGGLDINPMRTNIVGKEIDNIRLSRQ